jgi:voltage-gated potassium channel Kch
MFHECRLLQGLAIISVLFVLLSILIFCIETHLTFRMPRNDSIPLNSSWTRMEKSMYSKPHVSIEVLDFVCITYFSLEFILRIIFAPGKLVFFKSVLNWVDLLAIIPFYLEKFIIGVFPQLQFTVTLEVLKSFSLMRIFRIFKLTRHFNGLKILAHSIRASARELILLILFLLITVLIFASCVYYAESIEEQDKNDFKNIPVGFWWAVVTMTTLGYGDMYPRTGLGYLVGGLCAVAGVLVLALPVPVIVNNFALYYSHAQAKLKLPPKQKKVLVGAADQLKTQTALPGALEEAGLASSGPMGSAGSVNGSDDSGIKTGECEYSALHCHSF